MAKDARRLGRSCDFREDPYDEYSSALYKQLFDPKARPGEIIMNAIRFWAAQKFNFTRYGWRSCKKRNTCNYIKVIIYGRINETLWISFPQNYINTCNADLFTEWNFEMQISRIKDLSA